MNWWGPVLRDADLGMLNTNPVFYAAEQCDDYDELKRMVIDFTLNQSLHERIRRAMTAAGFAVRRVEKHDFHDIWEIRLLAAESLAGRVKEVTKGIRLALKREGIDPGPGAPAVRIDSRRVVVAFAMAGGVVGVA